MRGRTRVDKMESDCLTHYTIEACWWRCLNFDVVLKSFSFFGKYATKLHRILHFFTNIYSNYCWFKMKQTRSMVMQVLDTMFEANKQNHPFLLHPQNFVSVFIRHLNVTSEIVINQDFYVVHIAKMLFASNIISRTCITIDLVCFILN